MRIYCWCRRLDVEFSSVKSRMVLIYLAVLFCGVLKGQEGLRSFQNDICLPSVLYMLSETENDIFVEPLMKRWRPYNDVVRFSGSVDYTRRLQRVASIHDPEDGNTITLELVNQDEFKTLKSITSTLEVGVSGKGSSPVTVSIIGDSFTHGGFFKEALLEGGHVPYIKMIGLREVNNHPGQFDEGRGGWRLQSYFTVTYKENQAYNGFWQPEGENKYWGSTGFWKLVMEIDAHPDRDWSFGLTYNTSRFISKANLYDTKTGYKINPERGDMMYDNEVDAYVAYNGKTWKKVDYDDFTWSFNYGKYLSMWDLEKPMILAEFLGLNDFRDHPDPINMDFEKWNAQMEEMIASYFKAVPEGKFVLMIPSSTCGILDNKAGDFTTKQNAAMWEVRRNIIENFDHRREENIFIVDAGIAIDNVDGTRFLSDSTYTKPYASYEGEERIMVQTGNPHPYPNYPTMGISLAAFIQKHRNK
ncbi:hypothetical protein [Membranihabitans marinus]|uniref:hypothetical protein n=1 Tax=Membranihabitans marinus TaxID=1227546 RepID=UPI001F26A9D4|nr:hypothetical protein [Membranihabitans marinus]